MLPLFPLNLFVISLILFIGLIPHISLGSDLPPGMIMGEKHIVILQASQERVFSTLFLGVTNTTSESLEATVPLLYPRSTRNVQTMEGTQNSEIVVEENSGRFAIKKPFPPGTTVLSLRFSLPSLGSETQTLEYTVMQKIKHLVFLKQQDTGFNIEVDGFQAQLPSMLQGASFKGIANTKIIPAMTTLKVKLSSLPESRKDYYLLGAAFTLLLILGSALKMKTLTHVTITS